jgi:hypothetical protein
MANSGGKYKLLVIQGDDSELSALLLALNVGSEYIDITIDGED